MSEETVEAKPQLSKEEIAKRRAEVVSFYKEQIKHLKVQAEYEALLTEIEENRAKRLQAQMFLAQAAYAEDGEMSSEDVEAAKREFDEAMSQEKPRKLKRES